MARYSVNNYTVENLLSGLGDPANTDRPQYPPPQAGDIAVYYSTDFSDSAMLTFSSFPLMKRFVSRAKTTVITKLRA